MDKNPLASKTVWGGILLAIEVGLLSLDVSTYPWVHLVTGALGTFLTVYGFRGAIN